MKYFFRLQKQKIILGLCFVVLSFSACGGEETTGGGDGPDPAVTDTDGDGINDDADNCPNDANADQADADEDGIGDVCDSVNDMDPDGDGYADVAGDNCPGLFNPEQEDSDGNGVGDACDTPAVTASDVDGDGVSDADDNCINISNPEQTNTDGDAFGDACDNLIDRDGDGIGDLEDNCLEIANPEQTDVDGDGLGDVCDLVIDTDRDGIPDDRPDNCPTIANNDQSDIDGDGLGDVCDPDLDGDGVDNDVPDNCPTVPNPTQKDSDGDGIGDACEELTPPDPSPDSDGDGVNDDAPDNCPSIANADQSDIDGDGLGDVCDSDRDGDGVDNDAPDNCPDRPNPDQLDADGDGLGDVCDPLIDRDLDGIADAVDNCVEDFNPDQSDIDGDDIGDSCDSNRDGDRYRNEIDNCPDVASDDLFNLDGDPHGDLCDNCVSVMNPDQADADSDGVGDACDNCPFLANLDQADVDGDGVGDLCDTLAGLDSDGDGILDADDNCSSTSNPSQIDADGDGIGDACDPRVGVLGANGTAACRIKADGQVVCWGYNVGGILDIPEEVLAGRFQQISVGARVACALTREEGRPYCWGSNLSATSIPSDIASLSFSWIGVSGDHACGVLSATSSIRCWGNFFDGSRSEPYPSLSPLGYRDLRFTKVEVARSFTCGLIEENNHIVCWDANLEIINPLSEVLRGFRFQSFKISTAIPYDSAAITLCGFLDDGRVSCWDQDGNFRNLPEEYRDYTFKTIDFAGTGEIICGVLRDGVDLSSLIACWLPRSEAAIPVEIPEEYNESNFSQLAIGSARNLKFFLCPLIGAEDRIVCWGDDHFNQAIIPEDVRDAQFREIIFSNNTAYKSCGILEESGNIRCWGYGIHDDFLRTAAYEQLSYSGSNSVALRTMESVVADGLTTNLEFFDNETFPDRILDLPEELNSLSFIQVEHFMHLGDDSICGLLTEASRLASGRASNLDCWGFFDDPLLDYLPAEAELAGRQFDKIVGNSRLLCAFFESSSGANIDCWGEESLWLSRTEEFLALNPYNFIDLDISDQHGCALMDEASVTASGRATNLICWGTPAYYPNEEELLATPTRFDSVSTGALHTCALLNSEYVVEGETNLICWGRSNYYGEVDIPVEFRGSRFNRVFAGNGYNCALLADPLPGEGNLVCWGLGDGRILRAPE